MGGQVRRPVRRRLGRLPRKGVRPSEGTRHHRRGRRTVPPRPRRAAVGRPVRRRAQALRPDDGGIRRILRVHRPPDRTGAGLPGRAGPAGQHDRHGHLRQRGQRRGRTARLGQREQVLQQRARRPRAEPRRPRRPRRPQVLQPLPVGLDVRRQHAVPPLEAGDLPRRRVRRLHRALAQGNQGQG